MCPVLRGSVLKLVSRMQHCGQWPAALRSEAGVNGHQSFVRCFSSVSSIIKPTPGNLSFHFPLYEMKLAISGVFWNLAHREHLKVLRKSCGLRFVCSLDSLERKEMMLLTEIFNALDNRFLWLWGLYGIFLHFWKASAFLLHKDWWVFINL